MFGQNLFCLETGGIKMLENTAPERVFHYFEAISAIPRGSGNTKAVSDYCVGFAKEHGLEVFQDALNNIIIKKKASKGFENHAPVILQGHLDMVCEKEAELDFDFFRDGLKLRLDGGLLSAEGTTLGADDGIAVAMILAVLEDDNLSHPPLEAVFTVDEETGMDGAEALDVSLLSGSTLINLDSGEEGVLTVGCAGGAKVDMFLPLKKEKCSLGCKKISVSGLCGGHSGIDINKGRLNADKLLATLLSIFPFEFRLVSICGGFKDNVIPNACECVIAVDGDPSKTAAEFLKKSFVETDSGLKITVEDAETQESCFDLESTKKAVDFLNALPCGVASMSADMQGLVQSSSNVGILKADENGIVCVMSVRSSVAAEKQQLLDKIEGEAKRFGAELKTHGHYPAWEYRKDSRLRETMVSVFKKLYGKEPKVETVHAGLECGLFSKRFKNFDAVSMGPDMWDIHTVNERLSVSSTERTYTYLCNCLKEL